MIKISYSPYKLSPTAHIGRMADIGDRSGALLKVEWPGQKPGYSDLFPWPEMGDQSLELELAGIKQGKLSKIAEQSLYFAKLDSKARTNNVSIFKGAPRINNHYLITDLTKTSDRVINDVKDLGFSKIKVKVGIDLDLEFDFIRRVMKNNSWIDFRIDCSGKMKISDFERFFSKFNPSERGKIEYVEDPCPYDAGIWRELSRVVPLAVDNEIEKVKWDELNLGNLPFFFVVIKPARFAYERIQKYLEPLTLKVVVTSSLDHTIGVLSALYMAGEIKRTLPGLLIDCGCWSLRAYKPDDFSDKIKVQGSAMMIPHGDIGFGFQQQLEALNWNSLR